MECLKPVGFGARHEGMSVNGSAVLILKPSSKENVHKRTRREPIISTIRAGTD
ncbi:hypothetical protein FHW03_004762 [Ochrobactrum sp. RH2CCR150]|nr:hypothetical protein [Ochrobactrum sp. RH2CCR150]